MKSFIYLAIFSLFASCSTTRYYIVRHAEKETAAEGLTMSTPGDPPLSEAGKKRAEDLKEELKDENIRYIFSTKTRRTLATGEPLHELYGLRMNLYHPFDTLNRFVERLRAVRKGNVLIVGHSNTVDDLANALTGQTVIPADLLETEYDNLFIVTRRGKKFSFERRKYGSSPE